MLGLLLSALLAGSPQPVTTTTVTVLHSGDTYGFFGRAGRPGGVAKRAPIIDAIRAEEPHVLLVDNGNALGQFYYSRLDRAAMVTELYAELGYDAINLGAYDLPYGLGRLAELAGGLPFLSTAGAFPVDLPWLPTSRVVERGGLRILLLGVCEPVTPLAVRNGLDRHRGAVDLVILLASLDYAASLRLARGVPGIDLVISRGLTGEGGLEHEAPAAVHEYGWVGPPEHRTLVVKVSRYGHHLGRIDLTLRRGDQGWALDSARPSAIVLDAASPEDPALAARIAARIEAIRRDHGRPLFANAGAVLGTPITAEALFTTLLTAMRGAAAAELALIDRAALSKVEYTLKQIAAADALREIDLHRLLWREEHLVKLTLTGAQLREISADGGKGLIWLGLTREGDDLSVNGRHLVDAERYSLVTTNLVIAPQGAVPGLASADQPEAAFSAGTPVAARRALRELASEAFVNPPPPPSPYPAQWRLRVDHLTFELSSLMVQRDGDLSQVRDARVEATDLLNVAGSGRVELEYDSAALKWSTVAEARFSSVELEGSTTNPTDELTATSQVDLRAAELLGVMPYGSAGYVTEFTAPEARAHRHLLRFASGLSSTFDGRFLEMRLAPLVEVDLSLPETNTGVGGLFLYRLEQAVGSRLTLTSRLELRYLPWFALARDDTLELSLDFRLALAVEIVAGLALTPSIEWFLYQGVGDAGAGNNLTIGVGLTYRRLWKPQTERPFR